jgi:DNA-binding NarL/FixJ family response regulator
MQRTLMTERRSIHFFIVPKKPTLLDLPRYSSKTRWLTMVADVITLVTETNLTRAVYDELHPFAELGLGPGHHDHSGGSVAYYLGLLAAALELWDEAEQHFALALANNERWGYWPYVAYTRHGWADMLLRRGERGDRERALMLLAEAKSAAQAMKMVRLQRLIDELLAREGVRGREPDIRLLTPREQDVLSLLVEGKSDREIGDELYISHFTVRRHVSGILRKLDVDSRGAAAVYAVRNELV